VRCVNEIYGNVCQPGRKLLSQNNGYLPLATLAQLSWVLMLAAPRAAVFCEIGSMIETSFRQSDLLYGCLIPDMTYR